LTGRTHYHVSAALGQKERARLLLIHDQGAQHKGAAVEEGVREAQRRLMLTYLLALNPQECIWKWSRRVVTYNHRFATLREHIEALRSFFLYLADVKDQVRQLYGFKRLMLYSGS
jgi:hypothetical protein